MHTKQAIAKHAEFHIVHFSGWEVGGLIVPRWWEPPPATTTVLLDPAASPPPMCDGLVKQVLGFRGPIAFFCCVSIHGCKSCYPPPPPRSHGRC